jgi:putative FmdB family regulatory protein
MPIYEYECPDCKLHHESVARISERNNPVHCEECGTISRRIIVAKIQRNEPTWLADAIHHAIPHGSDVVKPTDRIEFNRYLKDNGIAHAE